MFINANSSQSTMTSVPKKVEHMTLDEMKLALWGLKESKKAHKEALIKAKHSLQIAYL
jgi:hypothetical protein